LEGSINYECSDFVLGFVCHCNFNEFKIEMMQILEMIFGTVIASKKIV